MYLQPGYTYYRGTEQCASRAPFLILFSWNDFKALDELRAGCGDCGRLISDRLHAIERHDGSYADMPASCPTHAGIRSNLPTDLYTYPNGKPKLWAAVRSVALH